MAGTVASALAGAVFGFALAAPPGPMNAIIAEESVIRGWTAGVTAGLGAMSADAVFFVLTLLGVVSVVASAPTLHGVMVGVGGLLMLYFAYGAASDASATFSTGDGGSGDPTPAHDGGDPTEAAESHDGKAPTGATPAHDGGERDGGRVTGTGFRKAFVLAMTNPYQILFWLTVGVGMLRPGRLDVLSYTPYVGDSLSGLVVVATGSPTLVVGFFAGIGVWIVAFPAALVALGRRVDRFSTAVAAASAAVLAGFGLVFLADAATTLA